MKGYPRHINTRDDLEVALELDQQRAIAWLKSCIHHREGWHVTGALSDLAEGIEDATHRVVDQGEDGENDWYQQEFGPLPGNPLDHIGISVAEAQSLAGE